MLTNDDSRPSWPRMSLATRASWGATKKRRCATSKRTGRNPSSHHQARRRCHKHGRRWRRGAVPKRRARGQCAVAIQKIMSERNFDVPAERRMLLRIGINLGDIIHDGTRTYGDGMDAAAPGSSRSPNPAASAFRPRYGRRSSASLACLCAMKSQQVSGQDTTSRPLTLEIRQSGNALEFEYSVPSNSSNELPCASWRARMDRRAMSKMPKGRKSAPRSCCASTLRNTRSSSKGRTGPRHPAK